MGGNERERGERSRRRDGEKRLVLEKSGKEKMKRYCQTLELRNDPELIAGYIREHQRVWLEIKAGIRQVGILDMQIYMLENKLFMIVDTTDEFDWEKDNDTLARLPRQKAWEDYMDRFQQTDTGAPSHKKWKRMKRIFGLNPE